MADRKRARRDAECGQCLKIKPLVMPVRSECMGRHFTDLLCLPCRITYDRAGSQMHYVGRLEGRHSRAHASPLPCSLIHLEWRAVRAA